jgi:photosystem II stability/assembly factor-like uncharacterized protein
MKRQIWILSFVFFFILILIPSVSQAQYLIHTKTNTRIETESSLIQWYQEIGGETFAVVPTLQTLDRKAVVYTLLDDDVETGTYYWIDTFHPDNTALAEACTAYRGKILWHDPYRALLRSQYTQCAPVSRSGYRVTPIHFQRPGPKFQEPLPIRETLHSVDPILIQAILDSVDRDTLVLLESHLTGEKPFQADGTDLDSIRTRFSYSYQIVKARDYVQSYLEKKGYTTTLQPFILYKARTAAFAPDNPNRVWMVSENRILCSSDEVLDWEIQYSEPSGARIHSLHAVNDQTVFAVGSEGIILKTTDGGKDWEKQRSGTEQTLFHVFFRDDHLGWACGDSGIFLSTTNGGGSWSVQQTPVVSRLNKLFFTDDLNGWAVGRSGTILHTTNSGKSWSIQNSRSAESLKSVYFLDPGYGFAVGWNGTALKTTNGGHVWTTVQLPVRGQYQDVAFSRSGFGMIVGLNGVCLKTRDRDSQWELSGETFPEDISALQLLGTGVRIMGEQNILESNDMGNTWQSRSNSHSAVTLHNIIATKTGTTYPDEFWIICAHYDATSQDPYYRAPGADDNGSGTAAVMEAARVLADYNFLYSIKFILFPGEEQGLWGSQLYAATAALNGEKIRGVINMDMIGYDSDSDGHMEIHCGSMNSSKELGDIIDQNCTDWGLPLIPNVKTYGSTSSSDHSPFWNVGYTAILIIEDMALDFNPFYHSTGDLLAMMNPAYYLNISRLAIGSLAVLAVPDTAQTSLPVERISPKQFELLDPYPNPFNSEVTVEYRLPVSGQISIEIFDLLGHTIHRPVHEWQASGYHKIVWNGTDKNGLSAASGIYFIRAGYQGQTALKKIIVLK